ncbi:MAG: CpsB/CapC family capsule biosynthesis tyrosine phosphatase [Anaerocolumna sp.]
MDGFIDIHSHILPEIDDGSKSMEQTIHMVKLAYEEGIRTMVATPHFHEGSYEHPPSILEYKLQKVKEAVKDIVPEMNILLGSEIYYSHEIVRLLRRNRMPAIAGTKYILVEFSTMADYRYIKNGLQEFVMEGYLPVIAHVERYVDVTKDLGRVMELIDMGVCIQVNADSITGETGRYYHGIAKKLLKYQYIHIIATDTHSDGARAPRIRKCFDYVVKKYGDEYAKELLIDNQRKILSDQYI